MAVGEDYVAALRAAGAIYYPIHAANHRELKRVFIFKGLNVSGAAFAAQVRVQPDAGGAALLSLTCAATFDGTDTLLAITASKAAIQGLPAAAELGRNVGLYWDADWTPVGEHNRILFAGEFVRVAGVRQ